MWLMFFFFSSFPSTFMFSFILYCIVLDFDIINLVLKKKFTWFFFFTDNILSLIYVQVSYILLKTSRFRNCSFFSFKFWSSVLFYFSLILYDLYVASFNFMLRFNYASLDIFFKISLISSFSLQLWKLIFCI